eukprot:4053894-Prymnesium_polylepis.1
MAQAHAQKGKCRRFGVLDASTMSRVADGSGGDVRADHFELTPVVQLAFDPQLNLCVRPEPSRVAGASR